MGPSPILSVIHTENISTMLNSNDDNNVHELKTLQTSKKIIENRKCHCAIEPTTKKTFGAGNNCTSGRHASNCECVLM